MEKNKIKILIVEDEALAADMLQQRLHNILGDRITSIKIVQSQVAAICHIKDETIDLLFLDLELHGESGFTILEEQISKGFQTIIVSGNLGQALRAFEYSVLDFVPKPYSQKRLAEALKRFEDQSKWKFCKDAIPVLDGSTVLLIPFNEIQYISSSGKIAIIHIADNAYQIKKSLANIQEKLPNIFYQIHRSHIINTKFLNKIVARSGGIYCAILKNGIKLPVSRTHYTSLKDFLHTA